VGERDGNEEKKGEGWDFQERDGGGKKAD